MLSKIVCKTYGYSTLCRQTIGLQFVVKYTIKAFVYIQICISQSLFDYEYNNKFVRYPTYKVFCLLVQTNSFEGHRRNTSLITRRTRPRKHTVGTGKRHPKSHHPAHPLEFQTP